MQRRRNMNIRSLGRTDMRESRFDGVVCAEGVDLEDGAECVLRETADWGEEVARRACYGFRGQNGRHQLVSSQLQCDFLRYTKQLIDISSPLLTTNNEINPSKLLNTRIDSVLQLGLIPHVRRGVAAFPVACRAGEGCCCCC